MRHGLQPGDVFIFRHRGKTKIYPKFVIEAEYVLPRNSHQSVTLLTARQLVHTIVRLDQIEILSRCNFIM